MTDIKIVNFNELDSIQLLDCAKILTESLPNGWNTLNEAVEEIRERHIPENTLLAALYNNMVVGWGGILPIYSGNVFELHPLVVHVEYRKKGIGKMLMQALEDEARKRNGKTIYIGADDEAEGGETSFANVDLYDNLPKKIAEFEAGTHQTGFYFKLGYKIVGVLPDANGLGKPDIFLAKALHKK